MSPMPQPDQHSHPDRPAAEANADTSALSPAEARARFRAGLVTPTSGYSAGFAQANLLAVPQEYAFVFLLFAPSASSSSPPASLGLLWPPFCIGLLFPLPPRTVLLFP